MTPEATGDWLAANAGYLAGQIRRRDFSEVVRAIDEALPDAPPGATVSALREVCLTGATVMDLDADTFAQTAGAGLLPQQVVDTLQACAMPPAEVRQDQWRDHLTYGALADLRPLYSLMLELVDEYYDRHEVALVLSLLHLMSDHLGQLAWQTSLTGVHPHEITRIIGPRRGTSKSEARWVASLPADHWARQAQCEVARVWTTVLRGYADGSPKSLVSALRDTGTRTATAIVGCAAPGGLAQPDKQCPNPCSVLRTANRRDKSRGTPALRPRAALAAAFADSPIVAARHHSPVGHFFTLPSVGELDSLWQESVAGLDRGWEKARRTVTGWPDGWGCGATGDERLAGLAALVGYIAGERRALPKSDVLPKIEAAALAVLDSDADPRQRAGDAAIGLKARR